MCRASVQLEMIQFTMVSYSASDRTAGKAEQMSLLEMCCHCAEMESTTIAPQPKQETSRAKVTLSYSYSLFLFSCLPCTGVGECCSELMTSTVQP